MSKPFFYRITAADFLAAIVTVPEADRGQWALQLALDMVSGSEDIAKTDFGKEIIMESIAFREKKSSAGRSGGKKKWENNTGKFGDTRAERMEHARSIAIHTSEEWEAMKSVFDYKCCICGCDIEGNTPTKDHVIPVSVGGSDGIDNIQPSCRSCNVSKGVKTGDYRFKGWKKELSKHLANPGNHLASPSSHLARSSTEAVQNKDLKPLSGKPSGVDEKEAIPFGEIISFLNTQAGKSYRVGKSHEKWIRARWADGFRLKDFKTAINNQVREWSGTEMDKFLRPETLFGNKMDGYVNNTCDTPALPKSDAAKGMMVLEAMIRGDSNGGTVDGKGNQGWPTEPLLLEAEVWPSCGDDPEDRRSVDENYFDQDGESY